MMETGFQVPSTLGSSFSLFLSVVLIELGKAPFVASLIFLSKSGSVKNYLFSQFYPILWWETELPISECTVGMRHFAIFQMIIILSGDTPARYIAIPAPERRECALISMGPKPNSH